MFNKKKEEKMTEFWLFLYGKPAWDMELEKELDKKFSDILRETGDRHKEWLHEAANIYDKLFENGWTAHGTLYDIIFYKDISIDDAKKELMEIGLEEYIDNLEESEYEE